MDLGERIQSVGARRAADSLNDAQLDRVLSKAASGDAAWLRAIVDLREGTDGAAREGVDQALSKALQTNPSEVLTLIQNRPNLPRVDLVCTDRAIELSVATDILQTRQSAQSAQSRHLRCALFGTSASLPWQNDVNYPKAAIVVGAALAADHS